MEELTEWILCRMGCATCTRGTGFQRVRGLPLLLLKMYMTTLLLLLVVLLLVQLMRTAEYCGAGHDVLEKRTRKTRRVVIVGV